MPGALQRTLKTPIGDLFVQADQHGLLLVDYADTERPAKFGVAADPEPVSPPRGQAQAHPAPVIRIQRHLDQFESELQQYFDGDLTTFRTPYTLRGTDFQQKVWTELRRIPYGHTTTYEAIARKLGDPLKTRAVGMANGRNCLNIIVPCHRVIRADGGPGGYGGGLWRKQRLLELESGTLKLI